ncbi:hypothetical protein B0H10DRAFT_2069060 [Mycena sp. CBHHK59/15]|nr:hypothetical protein B0H10DRAFT_2069060 [Mycena sp. CBHHK59/15]
MKSSPFFNELNTNYVPSDIEIMQIQTDLISHTEELARLNTLIHDLCSQRDEIQEYVDSHKALISAPRRLPDDIVREIFVACLPTYRNAVMSRREAPLVLCSISSAWRAIALSMPRLWAALHIPLQFAPANRRRSTVVSEWLQRSGVCPLSLSVVALSPWGQPDDDVTGTMNILAGFADRWQNLELSVTLPFQHQGLESVSAPMLSTMTLRIDVPVMEILSWKLLMGQSLHTLSLRACALDDLAALIPPAWENLIHLCLEDPNHYHGLSSPCVLAILRHCSRLTSIQFQMSESIIETQPGTCIVMPSLESFTILNNVAPLNVLEGLMECLSMPKLNDFGIADPCR